jgi:uncharacterized protein (TIGR03067 family)
VAKKRVTDAEAIVGLWRLVSRTHQGKPVMDCASHYLFEAGRVKEIVPDLVDDGSCWSTYELDLTASPKRITQTTHWVGKNGKPSAPPYVERGLYELKGETLRLCWPSGGGPLPSFSKKADIIVTFTREHGPPPQTKQPSGKQPVEVPGVGRLTWDDNIDWWEGQVKAATGEVAALHLEVTQETPERIAQAAQEFVAWLKAHEPAARKFAAEELLDLLNDVWNDGKPLTARQFVKRLSLASAGRKKDNSASLYYGDGGMFRGHSIVVRVDKAGKFKNATIAG